MITALAGEVAGVHGDGTVDLRCGPVVLELSMPLTQARELRAGDEVELDTFLYLSTGSDQLRLFGFGDRISRNLFATLLTGPGVGPKVALALLELGVPGLVAAVRDGDEKTLTSVTGVGPKLAKKIVLELSEKVAREFAAVAAEIPGRPVELPQAAADALDAVVALGFPRVKAEHALAKVLAEAGGEDTAQLIRRILALLSTV